MIYEFFKLNRKARKNFMALKDIIKRSDSLHTKQSSLTMSDKGIFHKVFANQIRHKTLKVDASTSDDVIEDFAKSIEEYIVKPIGGSLGIGVEKGKGAGKLFDIKKSGRVCLVEEVVKNHPDIAKLNPTSLNTLRVSTCIDKEGKLHIFNIALRVGAKGSVVDNLHNGGVCYPIDMETGRIDGTGYNTEGVRFKVHPSTGVFMLGYQIPNYEKLIPYVTELASVMPEARYVGWDVAITPDGFDIIEGNWRADVDTFQHHGGRKEEILAWM